MQYTLLKYRNYQATANTPVMELLHFHNLLVKDSREKNLDPYLWKVQAQPPK